MNREDGAFIDAFPFVKDINWAEGIDDTGRPIYVEANRPGAPNEAAEGGKGETVFSVPSFLGGKNWMPMAYSQKTGLFYVPSNEWGMDIWDEPISYKKGAAYLGAGFTIKPLFEDYIGSLKAIDPSTGEIKWEYKNDSPLWGGVMTTAGGLVFTGTPEGFLKAFDDETGEELWSFQTGSGVVGQPITWDMDGEQYVAVASGWGGAVPLWGGEVAKRVNYLNQGGMVWVFRLPEAARLGRLTRPSLTGAPVGRAAFLLRRSRVTMRSKVSATPAALELITAITAEHGPVLFHQSGGCCDGSSPMCYPQTGFVVGDQDVPLGHTAAHRSISAGPQYEAWKHTDLVIDVVPGRGGMFSLDNGREVRFLTRSRLCGLSPRGEA